MHYVDGFITPVPKANKEAYIAMAKIAAEVFKDHGALSCVECWGDDVPEGKITSFSMAVKREDDENVAFSWITWPSKAVRDKGMPLAMEDPRFQAMGPDAMPFDGMRMIFGGFETILES